MALAAWFFRHVCTLGCLWRDTGGNWIPGGGETGNFTNSTPKLQALVYDILPSTTAVFSYAVGSRKMLANEQFFVGA